MQINLLRFTKLPKAHRHLHHLQKINQPRKLRYLNSLNLPINHNRDNKQKLHKMPIQKNMPIISIILEPLLIDTLGLALRIEDEIED